MANYNMQKQADLTDHIESAVRSGADIGKAGLRTARDLWHKSVLPFMHSGEKVITEDLVNPAVSKLKEYAGPGWESLKGLYRKYGRPIYKKVVKGLTGLENFGSRTVRAVNAARNAAPYIRSDIEGAAGDILSDFRRLYHSSRRNTSNTIDNIKRDLILHGIGSSANFDAFKASVGPKIDGVYGSIKGRLSDGMNKSSSLSVGGLRKSSNLATPFIRWGSRIAKEESDLLAREAAERAAKLSGKTISGTMGGASSPVSIRWNMPAPKPAKAAQEAATAAAHTPQPAGTGPINFNVYTGQAGNAAAQQAEGITRETLNSTVEDAIRRAMASQGNAATSAAAGAVPATFMGKLKDAAPSALLYGGLGYGAHALLSGGDQQPQGMIAQQPATFDGAQMAPQYQNPLAGLFGRTV